MFGSIGGAEILMILVLALLLFGPRRLPQIGKTIGRAMSEFRRATQEFKSSLEHEVEVDGMQQTGKDLADVGREINDAVRSMDPRSLAKDVIARGTPPPPPRQPRTDSEAAPPAATDAPAKDAPTETEAGAEPQTTAADDSAPSKPTPDVAEDRRS
jgi:Tat protein translocase TatB subunit